MRVMYLTWGETPKKDGIFGSQVIQQLVETSSQHNNANFLLVSGLPLANSGFFRQGINFWRELETIQTRLDKINHKILPLFCTQHWFYSKKHEFPFFHFFSGTKLRNLIREYNPDVIHCRSYHAAWAALEARKITKKSFKIIFDERGIWPEEAILKKRVKQGDQNHQFMKHIERILLSEADATIAVSDTMAEHYKKLGVKRCETIYLSCPAPISQFSRLPTKNLGGLHYCYVGALGENTWHTPSSLFELYKHLRTLTSNTRLTIITQSDLNNLKIFKELPTGEVTFTRTDTSQDLHEKLVQCDIGLLPYFAPNDEIEYLVAQTVLATKTVEYLSAGLPVIANIFCGGASRLINNHKIGLTYDPNKIFASFSPEQLNSLIDPSIRKRATETARSNFSFATNAKKYYELYQNLSAHV